jgi:phage gpG-like protein
MTATLKLEGAQGLLAALDQWADDAKGRLSDAINATGLELRGEIVKMYQRGTPTGRVYRKYNPNRIHRASDEGEPPATDTGRLASSIAFAQSERFAVTVGSVVVYAAYLEFGTRRIGKRPAWLPAIEAMRPRYIARLERAIAEAGR